MSVNYCDLEVGLYAAFVFLTFVFWIALLFRSAVYPWYFFGHRIHGNIKHAKSVSLRIWFGKLFQEDQIRKRHCDLKIEEIINVDQFVKSVNVPKLKELEIYEFPFPLHVAVPAVGTCPSKFLRQKLKNLASHHFVVYSAFRRQDSAENDLILETYEYDTKTFTKHLCCSCQSVNGQIQKKERSLKETFDSMGSLFLLKHNKIQTVDRNTLIKKFTQLNSEPFWKLSINNCEHFANFLLLGEHVSYQILYEPLIKCILLRTLTAFILEPTSFAGLIQVIGIFLINILVAFWRTSKIDALPFLGLAVLLSLLIVSPPLWNACCSYARIKRHRIENRHLLKSLIRIEQFYSVLYVILVATCLLTRYIVSERLYYCHRSVAAEAALNLMFFFFIFGIFHSFFIGASDYLFHVGFREPIKFVAVCDDDPDEIPTVIQGHGCSNLRMCKHFIWIYLILQYFVVFGVVFLLIYVT